MRGRIRSMTGFGIATVAIGSRNITVETRSTNAKALEVRARVPDTLAVSALAFDDALRARFGRGRIDVLVRDDRAATAEPPTVDAEHAVASYRAFQLLAERLGHAEPPPLSILASVPGVFVVRQESQADVGSAVARATSAAADALDASRSREGATLRDEFLRRVHLARERVARVASRAPDVRAAKEARLKERLARAELGQVPPERVAAELAVAVERGDFAEELTRLDAHLSLFDDLCRNASVEAGPLPDAEPLGKRLDFLLQECLREASTLAAKAQDTTTSHAIVDVRVEIERLREQMQNVE